MSVAPVQLEQIAARLTLPGLRDVAAMATLVAPDLAVAVDHVVAAWEMVVGAPVQLELSGRTVRGQIEARDPPLDFALLRLEGAPDVRHLPVSAAPPEPGAPWESFCVTPERPDGVALRGTVEGWVEHEGRRYLRLSVADQAGYLPGASGAPLVSANALFGLMALARQDGAEWYAVPFGTILASPAAPRFGAVAQLYRPLDPAALDALHHADGMRLHQQLDAVRLEHLLAALLLEPQPAAELWSTGDAAAIRQAVQEAVGPVEGYQPTGGSDLPDMAPEVRRALAAAGLTERAREYGLIKSLDLLEGALTIAEHPLVERIRSLLGRETAQAAPAPPGRRRRERAAPDDDGRVRIAGYRSDEARGDDLLGIDREVDALCQVVAASDVTPPLSIGLFGEWGSGKSFFMDKMKERIGQLADQARRSPDQRYCASIVQIPFNAWHYMDTDLWASLTSAVFERLDAELAHAVGQDPRQARVAAMASSVDMLAEAERKKQEAETALRDLVDRRERLAGRDAELGTRLDAASLTRAAYEVVAAQPEVKQEVEQAARSLRLTTDEASARLLELRGVWGQLSALWLAIRHGREARWWLLSLALLVTVGLGTLWLSRLLPLDDLIARVTGLAADAAAAALALGAGALAAVWPFWGAARRALQVVAEVRRKYDDRIAAAKQRREQELRAARETVKQQLDEARRRVESASQKVAALGEELEKLRADRRMVDFVRNRYTSTDYTKHFGTVARARHDFFELCELLDEVRKQQQNGQIELDGTLAVPAIDRIVLYIDDLDRCPPDKVFLVLQAVHLLLALPFFVVVVGVDPRWLVHSLERQALGLPDQSPDPLDEPSEQWGSTPLNYLEKIFQIPFTLRPMGPVGFERLVDDLTRNPEPPPGVAPAETPPVNQPAGDGATSPPAPTGNGATGGAGASSELPPGQAAAAAPAQPTNGVGAAPPATPTLPTASGSRFLEIRRGERELIKTLFPLVPSPRAAKRLVNVYRLLRALVPPEERARFEADGTGEYRAALLLLGIQCGYPGPAADLIDDLLDNRPAGHWWGYVEALQRRHPPGQAEDDEAWRDLFRRLAEVRPRLGALPRCPTFVRWAPEVGRYSFRSGRVLVAR